MKGKNKLVLMLFAVIALVATGVSFAFKDKVITIPYANAAAHEGYSAILDGSVVFSAERVYIAENSSDRATALTYNKGAYEFNAIKSSNAGRDDDLIEYFGDYSLVTGNDKYQHKDVIRDGDFVLVADKERKETDNSIKVKQGIMVTFGGYYYDANGDIVLNTQWVDADGDGKIGANEKYGAKIDYLSVSAKLNGTTIENLPSARSYDNANYYDFTWFIEPSEATEGHYEIAVKYGINGESKVFEFDFYLLLNSFYEQAVEVVTQVDGDEVKNLYYTNPSLSGAEPKTTSNDLHRQYSYFTGAKDYYPTLTFDYTRYKLSYLYISGDEQKYVEFNYNASLRRLELVTSLYNTEFAKYYDLKDFDNNIVTLMFVDNGKYEFDFKYIYNNDTEQVVIDEAQIDYPNITLDIYGYQLKYSKSGFASADMTYLEIVENNTMFILVNGYTDSSKETVGSALGVNYRLVKANETENNKTSKTGTIISGTISNEGVLTGTTKAAIVRDEQQKDIITMVDAYSKGEDTEGVFEAFVNSIKYPKTDRGIWLTLNDTYLFDTESAYNSYYYYNATDKITADYIKNNLVESGTGAQDKPQAFNKFKKVTTFTTPGYYLVQVRYQYKDEKNLTQQKTQYFAFQIVSAIPTLSLYKTDENNYEDAQANKSKFYAHEYTNKNVYADWNDTGVFESKITGKIYYSTASQLRDRYPAMETLKAIADGKTSSSNIKGYDYTKKTIIKEKPEEGRSYLLVLEVGYSATKTYTYFTIDREKLSGFEVYEVSTGSIDNKAIYSIARDRNLDYISHTSKGVIDADFTINWDNKNSGAQITAMYKYTPFVKAGIQAGLPLTEGTSAKYIVNEYNVGKTSENISIQKPISLQSVLDINNVITKQGIYEFTLEDQAGNVLKYVIVVDRTEAVIKATYGKDETEYVSGQMVSDYVDFEWGTHKAIGLVDVDNQLITELLNNSSTYAGENSAQIKGLFKQIGGVNILAIKHSWIEIRLPNESNYYFRINSGKIECLGNDSSQGKQFSDRIFTLNAEQELADGSSKVIDLRIGIDKKENGEASLRNYTIEIVGVNESASSGNIDYNVRITPDKALGAVYSAGQDGEAFDNEVIAAGKDTKYSTDGGKTTQIIGENKDIYIKQYYEGQASDDGVFVFEWAVPTTNDNFNVTEVRYDYFQLMDKSELESVKSKNMYYPYKYTEVENPYILQTENQIIKIKDYEQITRDGNDKYRSSAINLGYETYYDDNDELVTRKVTKTGLYIITRTIEIIDKGAVTETSRFSYAFFVDRNGVVEYSTSNITEKIVGQFIHASVPNSEGLTEVEYDDFTKQGLEKKALKYNDDIIEYKVYLETNKLPTTLQVPNGKYVTGIVSDGDNMFTSYENLKLQITIYFRDTYNLLIDAFNGQTIKLANRLFNGEDEYLNLVFDPYDTSLTKAEQGAVAAFEYARYSHNTDKFLTLPGEYVFVVNDIVGKKIENSVVTDYNTFVFGIKLTNVEPETDVYAYAGVEAKDENKVYAEEKTLYTNQAKISVEILEEDLNSYNAQVDIATILIKRDDLDNPWLQLEKYGDSFKATNASEIKSALDVVDIIYKDDAKTEIEKYIIHLDTGLKAENDKIIEYVKNYHYTIVIKYILVNDGAKYYQYKHNGIATDFHYSEYNVYIDRTPEDVNLNELMESQGEYFKGYHNYLAEQNDVIAEDNINQNFAYRSVSSKKDYYALSNDLYYQFVEKDKYNEASKAMYALTIDKNSTINTQSLSTVYYRKLDFSANSDLNSRMGLLPICDTYFSDSAGFYAFYEGIATYTSVVSFENKYTYFDLMRARDDVYSDIDGRYYEIIEKDLAGNYTQYVVYFSLENSSEIYFEVHGNNISNIDKEGDEESTIINLTAGGEPETFIGIDYVDGLKGLAQPTTTADIAKWYPYYENINIYNASGERIKTIYTNSKSKLAEYAGDKYIAEGIESEIYDAIKGQGNYTIERIDVFGNRTTILVNNYTSNEYSLNTMNFGYHRDGYKYYICISDVSSKIDNTTYWYAKSVSISYVENNIKQNITYNTIEHKNGKVVLELVSADNENFELVDDRIYLAEGDYTITFTDVGGKKVSILLSTDPSKKDCNITSEGNYYERNNIMYTASEVTVEYNVSFYTAEISVYLNENTDAEKEANGYYTIGAQVNGYIPITLHPDINLNTDGYGSLRRFVISLNIEEKEARVVEIWIDTRATTFTISNINAVSKNEYVMVEFINNAKEGDYEIMELADSSHYTNVLSETVNISWTHTVSEYFSYGYQLYEFTGNNTYKELITNPTDNSYPISPKESNTGKYVLKVTIKDKNGNWIASKMYFIHMSTTITGLYKVTDSQTNKEQDYAAITNLSDVLETFKDHLDVIVEKFGVGSVDKMSSSFGLKTAIPMYISINPLVMEVNKDNGVDFKSHTIDTGSSEITFYRIYRSNYYTYAVIMKAKKTEQSQNILSVFDFETSTTNIESLLGAGASKTIYDSSAEYYKLKFGSYNKNSSGTPLEKHNKIIIDVYYNNSHAKQVVGGEGELTTITFKNGGSYTLYIKDLAGNAQQFKINNSSTYTNEYTIIVMKEVLYTVNGGAPIEYAYYSSDVTLEIDLLNKATGKNNYDINTITLSAKRNGKAYTGYTHPTESTKYIFSDYGTYIITITAKLLGREDTVTSYLVFNILNPNEARSAIDFTSISSYNIVSVLDISKTVPMDVTDKFLNLIQDKANVEVSAYNKLVTYERLAEVFGGTTQGKMKFKVEYQVDDDELLPARHVSFMFTLNNEKATINSSIEAGGKTTKAVAFKLNAANIYDQIGDCYLMINGTIALEINANSSNTVTEIKVSEIGEYYVQLVGDSGNVAYSLNFTIKEPLNVVSIILIVLVVAIVGALVGTFIWLRTRMKVR